MIRFTIPGAPVGKGRAKATIVAGRAKMYTPKKTASYEGLVAMAATEAMAGTPPLDEAVSMTMVVCCPVPASWSGKRQRMAVAGDIRPTTKPDIDNVVKGVLDGMNGVVFRDDVVVAELIVRKFYSTIPAVHVMVGRLVGGVVVP